MDAVSTIGSSLHGLYTYRAHETIVVESSLKKSPEPTNGVAANASGASGHSSNCTGCAACDAPASQDDQTKSLSSIEKRSATSSELTPEEQRQVEALRKRDAEVRAHEMAHLAAGGGLVRGGPSYTYEKGPDGVLYAIGGEVSIDTSPGRTPEETLARAAQVRAAALAPAHPSSQDMAVAAQAAQLAVQASAELQQQRIETSSSQSETQHQTYQQADVSNVIGQIVDIFA